jgi:phage RecT family recombinase
MLEAPETKAAMERVLPQHLTVDRMIGLAILATTQQPKLLECTPASVLQSVMQAAQLGLEINGSLGHAYLVPYGNVCQLIPGYRGMIYLAKLSGALNTAEARLVYDGELFEVDYGTTPRIIHRPRFDLPRTDDKIVAVYVVATLPDGTTQFEVMSREEVDRIRARSRASGSGPWVSDFGEMARKTPTRRGIKYLPVSNPTEARKLAMALELDNRNEVGVVTGVVPEMDTEESLSAQVRDHTRERMEALKGRMGAASAPEVDEAEWEEVEEPVPAGPEFADDDSDEPPF